MHFKEEEETPRPKTLPILKESLMFVFIQPVGGLKYWSSVYLVRKYWR